MKPDTWIECTSDFCGNNKHPGAWSDLWERPDGTKYLRLGGGWAFYGDQTPEMIDQSSAHFLPFLKACENDSDFGYAKKHWSNKTKS